MNPHPVRAGTNVYINSPDYSGVGIYSPLNKTYDNRNLTLNVTIQMLGNIHSDGGPYSGPVSLKYSIDGIDYGDVPLFTNTGTHVVISGYGTVDLPELPDGSHCLTLYLYGYNTRSFLPQFKSYVDTVYFSINVPTPTPSPTTSFTIENSTPATIPGTTDNGTIVTLTLNGNITASQITDAVLTSNQSKGITTISFNVTGQSGDVGFSNITIPKNLVPNGSIPIVQIDNRTAPNQGWVQDQNNYYVWYNTHFSTEAVSIVFATSAQSSIFSSFFLTMIIAVSVGAVVVVTIFGCLRKRSHVAKQQHFPL